MFLQVLGNVEVGVHAGFEDGDAADLGQLRGVRLVVEGAGDEDVEVGVGGFAGGGDEVRARDGAELGADEDGGALFAAGALASFKVKAHGADVLARPRGERGEGDLVLFVGLLDAGDAEGFEDHRGEIAFGVVAGLAIGDAID